MSAINSHRIEIKGETLREISERAMALFDAFFNREVEWRVTRFESFAELTVLRDGSGQEISVPHVTWSANLEAEALGIRIGTAAYEPALLFER